MRKAPPTMAGPKAEQKNPNTEYKVSLPILQISPSIIEIPVENLQRRPMGSSELTMLRTTWWAMWREGVRLPAELGVIVLRGWRP